MSEKTIIADDHPLFRESLRRIVQRVAPGRIIEVADTKTLLEEAGKGSPPIAMLLDLVFPGFEGATTIAHLRRNFPQTALIVISMTDDTDIANSVMAAGANGFISKLVSADEMVNSISQILDGEVVVCLASDGLEVAQYDNLIDTLPQRHVDVLVRLAQGKTNKEIARELDISPFTVRAHISALFKSLGVSTRSAASALAVSHGII